MQIEQKQLSLVPAVKDDSDSGHAATAPKKKFVSPEISAPVDVLEATTLFQSTTAEKQFELDLLQVNARFGIRKLLATGDIAGDYAKALRLYAGIDNGRWRTYTEVGKVMHLTKERVRQLLKPSKILLADILGDNIPWKPVRAEADCSIRRRPYRRKARLVRERAPLSAKVNSSANRTGFE